MRRAVFAALGASLVAIGLACRSVPGPRLVVDAELLAGKPLYSHQREELLIRDFFRDRRQGCFVDVGCYLPVEFSNTYFLERHLNWSGIAVDALAELEEAWRTTRPGSRFFNFLVLDRAAGPKVFYRSELPGVSSYLEDFVKDRVHQGQPVGYRRLLVPTITLTQLLDDNGVSEVDFLSMDIEGSEPLALAGFEIERFKPELVCVEAKPANRAWLRRYFRRHDYVQIEAYLAYDQMNYYFTPRL